MTTYHTARHPGRRLFARIIYIAILAALLAAALTHQPAQASGERPGTPTGLTATATSHDTIVKAADSDGESGTEGPEAIKTKVQTPGVSNPPTSLDATEETAGEVVITWTAPTEGPEPTGYKVYRKRITSGGNRGNTQVGTTGAATSYTDDTVAAEVLYVYTIRADNDAGNSGESSPVSITTKAQTEGAPEAPEDTSADQ